MSHASEVIKLQKKLCEAASKGNIEEIKSLLARGADVNASYDSFWKMPGLLSRKPRGQTALHEAAEKGHTETVRWLLEHGANVNAVDEINGVALQSAAVKGHTETVRCLLEHGANVNAVSVFNMTALMLAAAQGHTETVRCLLEHGANRNTISKFGSGILDRLTFPRKTARDFAAEKGYNDIVRLLDSY
ncbi:MAG: ankyrin repeat domain-containing protein [Deltaproteobacteria bacterium]|nr:ankyrin repeat domain-containing protein [Deltaproteobacteria bacterium]